jgi:nucleotide-binding universal stress UspA family protein
MFTRILVPLDGSQLAEAVLPVACYLGERLGATLVLFHVIERGGAETIHGQHHLAQAGEARAYLGQLATQLTDRGLTVEQDLHEPAEGDVARSIIEHTQDLKADLVLLCAHGHGGLRDVFIGNIAQQVLQKGRTPVFFLRPGEAGDRLAPGRDQREPPQPARVDVRAGVEAAQPQKDAPRYQCRRILLPLDITSKHGTGLPVTAQLARACGAAVHVMTVVPMADSLPPGEAAIASVLPNASTVVRDLEARNAREHLQGVVRELAAQELAATGSVLRGDTQALILATASQQVVDLIVLATHARGKFTAFLEGSVAPRVLAQATTPVLLVRES